MAEIPFNPLLLLRELLDRKRAVDAGEPDPPWPKHFEPGNEVECLQYLADLVIDNVERDEKKMTAFGRYCTEVEHERRDRKMPVFGPLLPVPVLRALVEKGTDASKFSLNVLAELLVNSIQLGQLEMVLRGTAMDVWCPIFRERKERAESRKKRALPATFVGVAVS